jgi:radical SAM superfamily enzyme YgiQ (UPF0313 family)
MGGEVMSDVVLVQPRVALLDELQDRPTLPLSLLMAASLVCQERSVALIDARAEPGWEGRLRSEVRSGPVCVGTTAMTGPQVAAALEVSRVVREEDPSVPVVWGGPHATLDPAGTASHPLVDAAAVGDGEEALLECVRALEGGAPLSRVRGLVARERGRVRAGPPRPHSDLDSLPDPPLHLVDAERYVFTRRGRRCTNVATTRGCPHRCTFCFSPVESGGRWRAMSAQRTLDLVERMVGRLGLGFVWFTEQESLSDPARALALARGFKERGLDVLWEAEAHAADLGRLSDAELAALERSGLSDVVVGVESGSQRMADALRKGVRVDGVAALNRRLARRPGISPRFSFMCAFPGETEGDLAATLALIARIHEENPRASTSCLNPAIPYPGTEYLRTAVAHGLVPPSSLEGWAAYDPWLALEGGLDRLLPWVTAERAARLRRLYLASSFLDDKSQYVASPLLRALSRAYRPLALARLRRGDTSLMGLEEALYWRARERAFPSSGGGGRRSGGGRPWGRGQGSPSPRP